MDNRHRDMSYGGLENAEELCTAVREEESIAVEATRKGQNSRLSRDQCMMSMRAMHCMHIDCCLRMSILLSLSSSRIIKHLTS